MVGPTPIHPKDWPEIGHGVPRPPKKEDQGSIMANPLMPKATAVWLVENTGLTFEQISEFCGLHRLEVQGIAYDEVAIGMVGLDPVAGGQVTQAEIERCEQDPKARL